MEQGLELPEGGALLERLNRLSVTRSFTPQVDIDWTQTTTEAELLALYPAWSLLEGTGADRGFDAEARACFARYQQINLMAFTGLLERHAIGTLAGLYDLESGEAFAEYVGHFIKEEVYHAMMFARAVRELQAAMPHRPPLPTRGLDRGLRFLFRLTALIPGRRLRSTWAFTILRFAEQVTIFAHQMVQSRVPRRESLVAQVWAFHALDEARHLAFDARILEQNRLWGPLNWLPRLFAAPLCVVLSLLLNANEIWAARRLGAPVRPWQLPLLMRRTRAPFKRRVFGLLLRTLRGGEPETGEEPEGGGARGRAEGHRERHGEGHGEGEGR